MRSWRGFSERSGTRRPSTSSPSGQDTIARLGRLELVYDDWLYPVFESSRLGRESLAMAPCNALTDGPVRVVVSTAESPRVAGVETTLPVLGYRPVGRFGPFRVYEKGDPIIHWPCLAAVVHWSRPIDFGQESPRRVGHLSGATLPVESPRC